MAVPLPAGLRNSHQNGGAVFLIFVADPRTVRLPTSSVARPASTAVRSAHADHPGSCNGIDPVTDGIVGLGVVKAMPAPVPRSGRCAFSLTGPVTAPCNQDLGDDGTTPPGCRPPL